MAARDGGMGRGQQRSRGGRGQRSIMQDVVAWRAAGRAEEDIRQMLFERGYKRPRIAELLKQTRPAAPAAAAAAPRPRPAAAPARNDSDNDAPEPVLRDSDSAVAAPGAALVTHAAAAAALGSSDKKTTSKVQKANKKRTSKKRASESDSAPVLLKPSPKKQKQQEPMLFDSDEVIEVQHAAFTTWAQGDITELQGQLLHAQQQVGTPAVSLEQMQRLLRAVPEAVLLAFDLTDVAANVHELEQIPEKAKVSKLILRLLGITREAEAFMQTQSGASAGADSSSK